MISFAEVSMMRGVFYFFATGFVIAQSVNFHYHFDGWYGWIVVLILSFILGGVIAGRLIDFLRL